MKIFLAGASGFVGERVLSDLLAGGHTVTALTHSNGLLGEKIERNTNVKYVQGDVRRLDEMRRAIPSGTEAIVYLPGILREFPKKGITFQSVHVEGVRNVLAAAMQAGAMRWIHMSALGTHKSANPSSDTSPGYYQTKWEAEELIRTSGLEWTILRPSLIFDDRPRCQHNFVDEIAKAIRMAPFVPIIGNGKFLFQPVSNDDVSQTIVQSLAKPETIGKIYELGGPDKITYRELVGIIARAMGTRKPAVPIPFWFIAALAGLLGRYSWFPISLNEIGMLRSGNYIHDPIEEKKWRNTFGLPLKLFSESVEKMLAKA